MKKSRWNKTAVSDMAGKLVGKTVQLSVGDMELAVFDPEIGEGVCKYITLAFNAARKGEPNPHCFGCLKPWTRTSCPIGIILFEVIEKDRRSDHGIMAALCHECYGNYDKIMQAVRRDFGEITVKAHVSRHRTEQ